MITKLLPERKRVLVTPKSASHDLTIGKRYEGWSDNVTVRCVGDSGRVRFIGVASRAARKKFLVVDD